MYAKTDVSDSFTATLGVIAGYDHEDLAAPLHRPGLRDVIGVAWSEAGGPPVVITHARVYYPSGPAVGELIFTLTGNRNPYYEPDRVRWVGHVILALEALAERFGQTTAQVMFTEGRFTYLRTDEEAGGSPIWHGPTPEPGDVDVRRFADFSDDAYITPPCGRCGERPGTMAAPALAGGQTVAPWCVRCISAVNPEIGT